MKDGLKVGSTGELRFEVGPAHATDFPEEGMPPVLSTPALIWFLEHAAHRALQPHFEPGESSVGTQVDVEHLAPTPIGQAVTCVARVVHQDGPVVAFQLEARDEVELIAKGFHRRRVVRAERFARRVEAKAGVS